MTPPARRPVPRLLPTSVIGSHALPGWFWTALEAIKEQKYGQTDVRETHAEQLVFEFANRELVELDLLAEIVRGGKTAGAGVVDVKSFYVETPEDVAERVRACLEHLGPEQLTLVPDCGFFQLPRWLCAQKLRALVAGVELVRSELAGTATAAAR